MTYLWYDSYKAAVLETDWTRLLDRIQSAEMKIHERQRILSLDHGGSLEERQAIADALNSMRILRTEATDWQQRQVSGAGVPGLET
jgi:hypothetical protein